MPGYIFPGAFLPGSFYSGGLPTPSDPTSVAKSFKKNSPGCGCCCKCCDQCEGDSPCRMLVSIGGRRFTLKKNGSSALVDYRVQDSSNQCYWLADVDEFTSGDCTFDNLLLALQGPTSGRNYYQWTLLAASGTNVVGRWTKNSGADAPACTEPHTLINDHGNTGTDCVPIGNAVIEPEKVKTCDPCCPECAGPTPEQWLITIGAETFTLTQHDFGGAHCYWSTSFTARVFGTSPGSGICEDYTGIKLTTDSLLIKVELTGGTTAVNWSVGFASLPDCMVTSTLTLQTSNTCTLPTTITADPRNFNLCGSSNPLCDFCVEGTSPTSFSVVIAGFTTGNCADCGSLNGTYVLDYYGGNGCECFWVVDLSPTLCGAAQLILVTGVSSISVYFATSTLGTSIFLWTETGRTCGTEDCGAISALGINTFYSDPSNLCNLTPTCTITAVP